MKEKWFFFAACRDMETDIFYGHDDENIAVAIATCETCLVKKSCLEYALSNKEEHGVWGGTTKSDRRRIIRKRYKIAREERELQAKVVS